MAQSKPLKLCSPYSRYLILHGLLTFPPLWKCYGNALVTGANKGIDFEICRQLASKGVMVILTCRNEERGVEAQQRLKEFGFSDNVVYHQLDVLSQACVAAVFQFVKT